MTGISEFRFGSPSKCLPTPFFFGIARLPIYTDYVDGQVRLKLVEGFNRVPAVQFSATELMALVFTRDLARLLYVDPSL